MPIFHFPQKVPKNKNERIQQSIIRKTLKKVMKEAAEKSKYNKDEDPVYCDLIQKLDRIRRKQL